MVSGRAVIRSSPGASAPGAAGVTESLKYCSRIRAATGAAESTPKPPRSTVTATTILGLSAGRHGDVPGLVGQREPALGEAALGGPGLAGDVDGEVAEHRVGGAALLHRGPAQAGHDRRLRLLGDLDLALRRRVDLLQGLAGDALDSLGQVRAHHRAAVGDRRVGDRHLQRVGLQVALADGEVDVVARRPLAVGELLAVELVAPGGGRDQPLGLGRQVDPGRLPQAQLAPPSPGSCRRPWRPARSGPSR